MATTWMTLPNRARTVQVRKYSSLMPAVGSSGSLPPHAFSRSWKIPVSFAAVQRGGRGGHGSTIAGNRGLRERAARAAKGAQDKEGAQGGAAAQAAAGDGARRWQRRDDGHAPAREWEYGKMLP